MCYSEPGASSSSSIFWFIGQHALMQDTGNQNAAWLFPVEHHVSALLHPTQPRADFIAGAAKSGIVGKTPATIFKLIKVTIRLGFTPSTRGR
jgi:hypothetical protein